MTTIIAGTSHIAQPSPSEKSEGAAEIGARSAVTGLSLSGGGPVAAAFVTRAANLAAIDKTETGKQPSLRSPLVAAYSNPAVANWLAGKRDDPAFSADPGTLAGWLAPQPDAMPREASPNSMNVLNISTTFMALITELLHLLSEMRNAEAKTNGDMGIMAEAATNRNAESIMRDGMQKAIFGGVTGSVGMVGAVGSAGLKVNALSKSKINFKHNIDAPAIANTNTSSLNSTLAGGAGGPQLPAAHRAIFDKTINTPNDVAQAAHAATSAANQRGIDRMNVYGDVAKAVGEGAGVGVDAVGKYMSATETSAQAISNLASSVAAKASDNGRDRNKTYDNMISEMLAAIRDTNSARSAALASITDRMRG